MFLCRLACHAEWHMKKKLAPILFDEGDPEAARAQRALPVEPAKPSPSVLSKAASKSTAAATAVHSFHTLLADLSTVVLNDVSIGDSECSKLVAAPTPTQRRHLIFSASIRGACSQKLAGRTPRIAFLQRKTCVFAPRSSG